LAVRVRLGIECSSTKSRLDLNALVNAGFESERPQLLIPLKVATRLGLWPNLPPEAEIEIYGTAGGPSKNYVVPGVLEVRVLAGEVESPKVKSDAVISSIEEEVLINDKLAGGLGITIDDLAEGLWGLKADPQRKIRKSELPQYWKL
jgi:hypothetical protein